jgi:thiamine phosphate synthase YjbQ (UPF0047 family)
VQFRRNTARTSSATVPEEKKRQSDSDMLQKLELLCPTKSYNEWVEHENIEQDLSDGIPACVTW